MGKSTFDLDSFEFSESRHIILQYFSFILPSSFDMGVKDWILGSVIFVPLCTWVKDISTLSALSWMTLKRSLQKLKYKNYPGLVVGLKHRIEYCLQSKTT